MDDIKRVISPTYDAAQVAALDREIVVARDLYRKQYTPGNAKFPSSFFPSHPGKSTGYVGINNIKAHDYLNVVVQLIAHVRPLRDFFLCGRGAPTSPSPLVSDSGTPVSSSLGRLIRRLWNRSAFKGHVSPHEFVNAISAASLHRFVSTIQADPIDLLGWLLNQLHIELGGTKRKNSCAIDWFSRGGE